MAATALSAPIEGYAAPGFEPVADEFARNFRRRGELGAACAAWLGGEKVVDLWGGHRDRARTRPWEEDTLVVVYSTSKGLAATCIALAQSRGFIDYDERVSHYWPEFAQTGEAGVTVRRLLGHEAGLCAIAEPLDAQKLGDLNAVAAAIAVERPAWEPGTRHGYHALSLGFYEGELIRRVDPARRSLGRFFAEEIAPSRGSTASSPPAAAAHSGCRMQRSPSWRRPPARRAGGRSTSSCAWRPPSRWASSSRRACSASARTTAPSATPVQAARSGSRIPTAGSASPTRRTGSASTSATTPARSRCATPYSQRSKRARRCRLPSSQPPDSRLPPIIEDAR